MALASARELVRVLSGLIKAQEPLTFFAGAGISMASPAAAPDWPSLRDALLAALLQGMVAHGAAEAKYAEKLLTDLSQYETRNGIRIKPEVVLHWIHSVVRERLFDAFDVLRMGSPNSNHRVLTMLSATCHDVRLATCNFDTYLEDALSEQGYDSEVFASRRGIGPSRAFSGYAAPPGGRRAGVVPVLKVHGTLAALRTIRATLDQVGRRLSGDALTAFRAAFEDRHVCVVGYSGNDFDLFPAMARLAPRARSVLWLVRDRQSPRPTFSSGCPPSLFTGNLNSVFRELGAGLVRGRHEVSAPRARGGPRRSLAPDALQGWGAGLDIGDAAHVLAQLGMHVGMPDMAEHMGAVVLAAGGKDRASRARIMNVLGNSNKRRDSARAMRWFRHAEQEARAIRQAEPGLYGNILGNIGELHHVRGGHSQSLSWLRRSNRWAQKARHRALLAANEDGIGCALRALGRPDLAIPRHKRALEYRRANGRLIEVALSMNNLGLAYSAAGDHARAVHWLGRSLELKRKETADLPALAIGLLNVGEEMMKGEDAQGAACALVEARAAAKRVENPIVRLRAIYDLAETDRRLGDVTRARRRFRTAERLSKITPFWRSDASRMKWIESIRSNFLHN